MLFGSGDNGKSVFIKLIESLVSPQNTSHVTLQDLDGNFSSADLYGKLVNTFADLPAHKLSSTGTFKTLVSGDSIRAQPLTKDSSTGNVTEVDISIDPGEPLPANGTVTISTEGGTDTDMNAFPPDGVYVIISSDTVTVTNQTVDIG